MTPEGKIVHDIRMWVKKAGGDSRKCEWASRRGAPDLFIMLNGEHYWLEVKSPTGTVSALQEKEIDIMRRNGCRVEVVRSLEDARGVLEH